MNGLLGLNVRTLGVSRDQIQSAVQQIGCAFVLVQDDPDLIAPLKALGVKTIYRQSNDETLTLDPATFVQTRAEKGADYVYLTNELDPTPDLLSWTNGAIDYANAHGIKLCIFNFSTGRSAAQWQAAHDVAQSAIRAGHAVGFHAYPKSATDPDVQNYLALKHELGGLWIATEFAFQIDAWHGWRGTLTPFQYGNFLDQTIGLFAQEQMPVLLFSGDNWPANAQGQASGFGVLDNAEMIRQIAITNEGLSWKGIPVVQQTYPAGTNPAAKLISVLAGLNLRQTPGGTLIRTMTFHEAVTVFAQPRETVSGHPWLRVTDALGNSGWAADDQSANGGTSFADPPAAETHVVQVANVPYASEFGWADGYTALCGETSLYMLLKYDRALSLVALPSEITPLSIARYLGKGGKDFSSFADLIHAGLAYGLALAAQTGTVNDLAHQVSNNGPVIALLDYSKLPTRADQQFTGNHILVVVGLSDQSVICNDPDDANGVSGQYIHYPRQDFLAAWQAVGSTMLVVG